MHPDLVVFDDSFKCLTIRSHYEFVRRNESNRHYHYRLTASGVVMSCVGRAILDSFNKKNMLTWPLWACIRSKSNYMLLSSWNTRRLGALAQ